MDSVVGGDRQRVTGKRGRPGHDLESVLTTSVTVFTERGFDRTSIDDLARALGVSKSAIYHHVDSKDALLGLALDRGLEGLEAAAVEARTAEGPALPRLEQLLRASVAVLVERLPYVTLLLRVRGNSEVERQALTRRRRIDRIATGLVEQAIAEGDLRSDVDPILTARLLFGAVNSLTEWLRPDSAHDPAQLADAVSAVAFDGLRTGLPVDLVPVGASGRADPHKIGSKSVARSGLTDDDRNP